MVPLSTVLTPRNPSCVTAYW